MTIISWQNLSDSLIQNAVKLGIDIPYLKAHEEVERLQFSIERVSGAELSKLTQHEIREILFSMTEMFGSALSLRFILHSKTILQTDSVISDTEIDDLLEIIRDGLEPRLDFNLDKKQVLATILPPEKYPHVIIRLFLFPESLQSALSAPLTRLEYKDGLWDEMDDQHRLVIIVPDREINLMGEYLIVVGGKALEKLPAYLELPKPLSDELVQRIRNQALDPLSPIKWVYFKLKFLTPLHLHVDGEAQIDDSIAEALYTQLMNLCLIYSADRTKGPANDDLDREGNAAEWRATFTQQGHIFEVVWNGKTRIPRLDTNRWANPLAWSNIISFAYCDKIYSFDRLRIVQLTVAHNLEGLGTDVSYNEVVSQSLKIQKYAYDSWGNFIEGKIKEYFAQLRDVESAVDAVTEKFQEQVGTLTRTVFENALTADGDLIGTFIAAAFHDKFNPWLFWIGIVVYLLYLMIFPHWLGLKLMQERFDQTLAAFEKRYSDFKSRLSATVVDGIVGNVISRWKGYFYIWSGRAKFIYRAVAVFLLVIAILVTLATSVEKNTLLSATPTLTSTLVPSTLPSETPSPLALPSSVSSPSLTTTVGP